MKKSLLVVLPVVIVAALYPLYLILHPAYLHFREDNDPPNTFQWMDPSKRNLLLAYSRSNIACISDFERVFPRCTVRIRPSFPKKPYTEIVCQALVYGRYDVMLMV